MEGETSGNADGAGCGLRETGRDAGDFAAGAELCADAIAGVCTGWTGGAENTADCAAGIATAAAVVGCEEEWWRSRQPTHTVSATSAAAAARMLIDGRAGADLGEIAARRGAGVGAG